MKAHRAVGMVWLVVGIGLGGCASEDERQAFEEFDRLSRSMSAEANPAAAPGPSTAGQPAGAPTGDRLAAGLPAEPALADYLSFAAVHNPGLEAAFLRWKAALERIPQARALNDPQFTYRYFIVAQAARGGDMRHMFEISQAFPWLGKLELRGDVAAQEARAERQRFEAERLRLFQRVKQAYYEYYYVGRAIAITQENVDQWRAIEGIARARYATNAASAPDVIRAQIELAKMENELRSLQDLRQPSAAKLNAAMALPAEKELPFPPPREFPAMGASEAELAASAEEANPELKAMRHRVAREKSGIELAKKDYFPDVMVGYAYNLMEKAAGLPAMDMHNPMAVSVGLSIPIWWQKYAAGVREAQARLGAAGRDLREKTDSLQVDLRLASYNYRNADRKIALYRDALVPKARQSLRSVQASYQTGASTFTDLIDAQRVLLELQLSYERAVADRQQSLAELETLVGRPLGRTDGQSERTPSGATTQPATTQP